VDEYNFKPEPKVGLKNYGVPGLPDCENCMILRSLVLTHYQRMTNGWMDTERDKLVQNGAFEHQKVYFC